VSKDAFSQEELAQAAALYSERRLVRFQDVDAASIVFYPRVLEYFSDAYMGFFSSRGYEVARAIASSTYGLPLAHAEADYAHPLRFGDAIEVAIVGARVGATSFRVGYRVTKEGGRVAAVGQTVHVAIDRARFAKVPIPDEVKKVLAP
jgi:1,4-dihydroxy-2-naphthoyl-CoA hydrolase